jgi:hypothetical protein
MADNALAEITPLPKAVRGGVLTSGAKLAENGLFLCQFLIFAALAFAPAIAGGVAATRRLFPGNQALSFSPVLIGLGLTAGLCWFLGGSMLRKPWSADYMFRRARAALLERPDSLVGSNMVDAIYTEVVPRRNWGTLSLQNAEDVGFLHVDAAEGRLVIEGDNKRYQIPAASIVSCNVELMNPSAAEDKHGVPVGLVVLVVRDRLGERELPLRPVRTIAGDPLGGNYMERARALQERILAVAPKVASVHGEPLLPAAN